MKKPLSFLFLLLNIYAKGQDTAYYNSHWEKISSVTGATYFKVTKLEGSDSTGPAWTKSYELRDQLINESHYSNLKKEIYTGQYRDWYNNGKLQHDITYNKKGNYEGKLFSYYRSGQLKREDTYSDGNLINGKCYTAQGMDTTWYDYRQMPMFPGDEMAIYNFIQHEVNYPRIASRHNVSGKVYVQFVIEKDGSMSGVKVRKFEPTCHIPSKEKKYQTYLESSEALQTEACRVVNRMPSWFPGSQDGEKVRINVVLPIKFSLK